MTNTTHTAKHTPGPWVSTGPHSREVVTYNTGTYRPAMTIATVNGYWDGEALANMHLVAAAPAMYEALTTLLPEEDIVSTDSGPDECRWCGRTYPDYDNEGELPVLCTSDDCPGYIARQAIAQAEGKQ